MHITDKKTIHELGEVLSTENLTTPVSKGFPLGWLPTLLHV